MDIGRFAIQREEQFSNVRTRLSVCRQMFLREIGRAILIPRFLVAGRLHIRQALDGKVMAWLDMVNTSRDARTQVISIDESSRQVLFESVTQNRIILRIVPGIGPEFHYEGTLSADRKTISGEWRSEGAPGIQSVTGPHFLAPMLYRHVD